MIMPVSGWYAQRGALDSSAVDAPSYSYIGHAQIAGASGGTTSANFDIGTASANRFIIVGYCAHAAEPTTQCTVGGVALTQIVTGGFGVGLDGADIWAGLVTTGSGSQAVLVDDSAATRNIQLYVWRANNLGSTTVKHTGASVFAATSCTINVTAGEFLFAVNAYTSGTLGAWTGSTETFTLRDPTNAVTASDGMGGDLTVASSNAAFTVAETIAAPQVVCATWI